MTRAGFAAPSDEPSSGAVRPSSFRPQPSPEGKKRAGAYHKHLLLFSLSREPPGVGCCLVNVRVCACDRRVCIMIQVRENSTMLLRASSNLSVQKKGKGLFSVLTIKTEMAILYNLQFAGPDKCIWHIKTSHVCSYHSTRRLHHFYKVFSPQRAVNPESYHTLSCASLFFLVFEPQNRFWLRQLHKNRSDLFTMPFWSQVTCVRYRQS